MRFSPRFRMDVKKVMAVTIGFIVINTFTALLIDATLSSNYSLGPSKTYSFPTYIALSVLVGLIAGALGGIGLVVVNNYIFRKKSFGYGLASTAIFFVIVFGIVNTINAIVIANLTLDNPSISEIIAASGEFMLNSLTLIIFLLWGIVSVFSLFLLQVNDKFGPGVLWKFINGRYHKPREEERVFMFADMRSSTTIAEKIGHKKYFNLLSDLFADITNTILNYEGEIYQYVGDEIVICWPLKNGVKQANCLHCFLQIEQKLIELGPQYEHNYGVIPELKAGIHHGKVMAGEVGVIKRDITYSGDVLNTTARIQEQCNKYKVNLLISEETLDLLDTSSLKVEPMGEFDLRGKQQTVQLYTIR